MTKKHFIALANAIREYNRVASNRISFGDNSMKQFESEHLSLLADFMWDQNSNFNRERWLSYVKGECGPSGGAIKNN